MRQLLSRRALPAAVLATLLLPAAAGAATHCVPAPCGDDPAHAFATVRAAITAADAAPGPDLVAIGAGTFDLGEGVLVSASDTSVQGAGRGATILTADPFPADDPGTTRAIVSGAFARLSDVTVRLASVVTAGPATMSGVDVSDGVVERVRVDAEGAVFGPGGTDGEGRGITLRRGTLRDAEVAFDPAADAEGLRLGHIGGAVALEDVTVTALDGIVSMPQAAPAGGPVPVVARRLRLTAVRPLLVVDGSFALSDSLVLVLPGQPGDEGVGIELYSGRPPSPASLTLDRVTLAGSEQESSAALVIGGGAGPVPTRLIARHLLATGFPQTLRQESWGGDLETTISYSLADTRPAAIVDNTDPEQTGTRRTVDVATGNRSGDARFADPAAGDYSLGEGSAAIDVGGDDLIAGGATDLAGGPRPLDGDGDGVVAGDAGAFEARTLQRRILVCDVGCMPPQPQPPQHRLCMCGPPPDRDAPKLSGVTLSSARLLPKARRAASLRFVLSEEATVRVSIERRVVGRGRGARARWVAAGALRPVRLAAGSRSLALRAQLGRRALRAGAYRAVLVATDAAGNRSAAKRVRFSVARASASGRARRP